MSNDYLRRMLEMAKLPIPAELRRTTSEDEEGPEAESSEQELGLVESLPLADSECLGPYTDRAEEGPGASELGAPSQGLGVKTIDGAELGGEEDGARRPVECEPPPMLAVASSGGCTAAPAAAPAQVSAVGSTGGCCRSALGLGVGGCGGCCAGAAQAVAAQLGGICGGGVPVGFYGPAGTSPAAGAMLQMQQHQLHQQQLQHQLQQQHLHQHMQQQAGFAVGSMQLPMQLQQAGIGSTFPASAPSCGPAAVAAGCALGAQLPPGMQLQAHVPPQLSAAAGRPDTGRQPRHAADRGKLREPHDPKRKFVGTVTRWDDDAGFGFISSWEAYNVYAKDIFVHKAQIGLVGGSSTMYAKRRRSEIRNGDTVSYTVDLSENPGKPRAYNVEKLAAPPESGIVRPASGDAEAAAKRSRPEAGGRG